MGAPPPLVQCLAALLAAHRDRLRDIEACCSDVRSDPSVNLQEDPLSPADEPTVCLHSYIQSTPLHQCHQRITHDIQAIIYPRRGAEMSNPITPVQYVTRVFLFSIHGTTDVSKHRVCVTPCIMSSVVQPISCRAVRLGPG